MAGHPIKLVKDTAYMLAEVDPYARMHLQGLLEHPRSAASKWASRTWDAVVAYCRQPNRRKLTPEQQTTLDAYVALLGPRQRGKLGSVTDEALAEAWRVRLPVPVDEALTALATIRGVNQVDIIREAISAYLVGAKSSQ